MAVGPGLVLLLPPGIPPLLLPLLRPVGPERIKKREGGREKLSTAE